MQLRFRIRFIAVIAVILLLTSCSKSNKQGRLVPKDAGFVLHWNSKSLSGKLNMNELKQADWYREIVEKMNADSTRPEFIKKLSEYGKNSGLDSLSDLIFFVENSGTDGIHLVLEAGLKDPKTFESFLKNVYPQGSISKDGDLQVLVVEKKAVVTWNTEKVIAGFMGPKIPATGTFNDNGDNGVVNILQMTTYCKNLYTLKEDNSMAKDEKFTDLMNTEGDVHAWVNYGKLMSNIPQMGMLSMMKMDKFIDGNITAYTLNFDNGKVTLKSKGYSGKELNDVFKKYSGGSINTDMLKNIPSQDVVGVVALHFKPEGLKELVKLSGMDGFIDLFLARNGFTTDDFIKANKGDIMIALTDLAMKKDSMSYPGVNGKMETFSSTKPDAKFIFSAAINDKDAFNKIINFAKTQAGDAASAKISYNTNKDYFAIGNSPDYINKYLAGTGKNELPFLNKINGNPLLVYVDLRKIMKVVGSANANDSTSRKMLDESLKIWDNITMTGLDYSGGGINQTIELDLVDKNTNSLKQMFKYMVTMGALAKEKQKTYMVNVDSSKDSTTVTIPPRIKRIQHRVKRK